MSIKPLTCIIIDDEPLAVSLLQQYAAKEQQLRVLATFTNPLDAIRFLKTNEPDCIFLDVQMPEVTGLAFMQSITKKILVVFTTAYDAYAVDAFDLDVVDYLLKPVTEERFHKAVIKLQGRKTAQPPGNSNTENDWLFIKSGYKMVKVHFEDILYLEGMRDYTAIHTITQKILTLQSMRQMETLLPGNSFARVHKSYIVNLSKITVAEKGKLMIEATSIPVGSTYAETLNKKYLGR
ncbi:MAG: response regulator transcription factor [Ferruginibacter sp.]|nr:response regulator transcription factor [Ferruginibacter sp.]